MIFESTKKPVTRSGAEFWASNMNWIFTKLPGRLLPDLDFWRDRPVFITGGTGFLGSYIVELLVYAGGQVAVLDNGITGCDLNLSEVKNRIDIHYGSIGSERLVEYLVGKAKTVFHLASHMEVRKAVEAPAIDFETNVLGSHNVFDAVRKNKVEQFIYASSCAVYGKGMAYDSVGLPVPNNPYGVAKRTMEMYGEIYHNIYNMPFAAIRLFSLVGPRMRQTVIFDLLQRLSQDPTKMTILGDGLVTRDFNDVRLAAAAMVKLAEKSPQNLVCDLSGQSVHNIREIAMMLLEILGKSEIPIEYTDRASAGDMEYLFGNNAGISQFIGPTPTYVSRDGLKEYIEWADATFHWGLLK